MAHLATVTVAGIKPAPKGSKRLIPARTKNGDLTGKVRQVPMAATHVEYRDALAAEVRKEVDRLVAAGMAMPHPGAVHVVAEFFLARPANPTFDEPIAQNSGDLDKYQRMVGDVLEKAGFLKNDAQITGWVSLKDFQPEPGLGHKTVVTIVTAPPRGRT